MRTAIVQRCREEKRKRDEAEKERRARERAQLQKEVQEEEEQLKKFDDWMEAWERAERMRKFITAYAEKSSSWSAEKQPKYKAWIEWATQRSRSSRSLRFRETGLGAGSQARDQPLVAHMRRFDQSPSDLIIALEASPQSRRVPCAKSVPESDPFMPLGLALSEKQIPQITENTEK